MHEVYEYRLSSRRSAIWLAAALVAFSLGYAVVNSAPAILTVICATGGVLLGWMLMANPMSGIRVDHETLVLNAWRRPREIPLSEIAYLRMTHWTDDSTVSIVYKDGREEGTNYADMPPPNTLAAVMAARGIPVYDPSVTP